MPRTVLKETRLDLILTTSEASPRCNYTSLRFLPWNTKFLSRRKTRSEGPVTLQVPSYIPWKWSNPGTLNLSLNECLFEVPMIDHAYAGHVLSEGSHPSCRSSY